MGLLFEMIFKKINTRRITNWKTFHNVFIKEFGFLDYYGRNMNAWIDCMDDFLVESVVIDLGNCNELKENNPDILEAILECSAFINHRRTVEGENSFIIISMI